MKWLSLEEGKGHVPICVTAIMHEPIVYAGDLIHLDSILGAAKHRDMTDRERRGLPAMSEPWAADLKIPLSKWGVEVPVEVAEKGHANLLHNRKGQGAGATMRNLRRMGYGIIWGWRASAESATWLQHGAAEVRKKPALDEMREMSDAGTATISAGPMKAYDLTLPTVFAHEIRWYAHGDPDRVQELLSLHVPGIGKKRNLGFGTVGKWRVERMDEDWSIEAGGELMRRMPSQDPGAPLGTIRTPYHHRSRL